MSPGGIGLWPGNNMRSKALTYSCYKARYPPAAGRGNIQMLERERERVTHSFVSRALSEQFA